jgi:NADH dehydrogenase
MEIREVTVFGAAGFVGRNVVRQLAENGIRVRAACRDPEAAAFLKTMGAVGQISIPQANLRFPASIEAAVDGVDAVINLTGILYQRGAQSFEAVHVSGAAVIAEAAKKAGAKRLIQMSALGADANSSAKYARSKAAGEAAVEAAFPGVTILRPSVIFGAEDNFFNLFASLARFTPALPLIGGGQTKFQPVYVGDVAAAIDHILADPNTAGQIFELGGPRQMSFEEVLRYITEQTGRKRFFFPWPFALTKIDAFFLQLMPKPLLTMDQVELLKSDNVIDANAPGLDDLGIVPTPVESVVPGYLARYRRAGKLTPSRFS